MTNHTDDGGKDFDSLREGMDLTRRMLLGYCDDGDAGLLHAVNGARSVRELGYAATYLVAILGTWAEAVTGSQENANKVLRMYADGTAEHSFASQLRLLTMGGE